MSSSDASMRKRRKVTDIVRRRRDDLDTVAPMTRSNADSSDSSWVTVGVVDWPLAASLEAEVGFRPVRRDSWRVDLAAAAERIVIQPTILAEWSTGARSEFLAEVSKHHLEIDVWLD